MIMQVSLLWPRMHAFRHTLNWHWQQFGHLACCGQLDPNFMWLGWFRYCFFQTDLRIYCNKDLNLTPIGHMCEGAAGNGEATNPWSLLSLVCTSTVFFWFPSTTPSTNLETWGEKPMIEEWYGGQPRTQCSQVSFVPHRRFYWAYQAVLCCLQATRFGTYCNDALVYRVSC